MAPALPTLRAGALLRAVATPTGRAASVVLRPVADVTSSAFEAGANIERRALDRVIERIEFERLVTAAINNARVQAVIRRALESDGAGVIVASLFESGLVDRFVDQLIVSPAVGRLVEEIADSPSVTAAITQQSLGFADQMGEEIRTRSRTADEWLDRNARRLLPRRRQARQEGNGAPAPSTE
jgi:hypothetical protein